MRTWTSTTLLGVRIDRVRKDQALNYLDSVVEDGKKCWVITPNPEILLKARQSKSYGEILNTADLAVPDGSGVVVAAEYLKRRGGGSNWLRDINLGLQVGLELLMGEGRFEVLPEQVSGDVLSGELIRLGSTKKWKFFLLGGGQGVAESAAELLRTEYPGLKIVGQQGPVNVDTTSEEEMKGVLENINAWEPDILLVGFGAPKQEKWLHTYLERLNVHVAMGVGGTINELAGRISETPEWMRRSGLRWLWRLIHEPKRFSRIWNAVVVFPWTIFRS